MQNIIMENCIVQLPRSEEDKWTPSVMPPLPPSTQGLSRQSSIVNENITINSSLQHQFFNSKKFNGFDEIQ